MSREEDVKELMKFVAEQHGRLDCLFNNAGASGAHGNWECPYFCGKAVEHLLSPDLRESVVEHDGELIHG